MNETLLFDSLSSPVPELRRDLQIIPIQDNGTELLYFHDTMGYTSPNFAIDRNTEPLLSLITGRYSIQQIVNLLNNSLEPDDLLDFVQMLDHHRILDTKHYRLFAGRLEKDFESAQDRKAALAGDSYPKDPDELKNVMNRFFNGTERSTSIRPKKALYAPHIDLKIGIHQYTEAFSAIRDLKPKRVVMIGTSHYSGYFEELYAGNPFIGTTKTYSIPGRTFSIDQDFVAKLSDLEGFTLSDRAHRKEHSLETHLIFISHLWSHDFKLVPILVSGFDELFYQSEGDLASMIVQFSAKLNELDNDETFYLISGDLSHVGKKFGDAFAADEIRDDVEAFDRKFIDYAVKSDASSILTHLSADYDPTRICGYPPLFTFLKAFPGLEGKSVNYHWWDEKERESAVSFGSIAY